MESKSIIEKSIGNSGNLKSIHESSSMKSVNPKKCCFNKQICLSSSVVVEKFIVGRTEILFFLGK